MNTTRILSLVLRLYWPKEEALDDQWKAPSVSGQLRPNERERGDVSEGFLKELGRHQNDNKDYETCIRGAT